MKKEVKMLQVKFGTYPVTLTAYGWTQVLMALGAMRDEFEKLELFGLAEDANQVWQKVHDQVMEDR